MIARRAGAEWCWALALTTLAAACDGDGAGPSPGASGAGGSGGVTNPPSAGASTAASGRGGDSGSAGASPRPEGGGSAGSDVPLAGGAGAADAGAGGADSVADCTASLSDIQVHASNAWDPLGYPPYALDGCRLVYVAAGGVPGALVLRELSTGAETELDAAAHHPRRPSVAGSVIAWESDASAGSQVRVVDTSGTEPFSISFEAAAEPRVTVDAVVFTAFIGAPPNGDTDVQLYDLTARQLVTVAGGPAQQRFADVSATHVAVTDFVESAKGYFDETEAVADIVTVDRRTLQATRRESSGKQAFPLLGDSGVLAYLAWGAVHPEPKFSQFQLMVGRIGDPVSMDRNVKGPAALVYTDPAYVRPSLRGQYLDYIDLGTTIGSPAMLPQLFRADLSSELSPSAVTVPGSGKLLGPVAQSSLTLVARPAAGSTTLGLMTVAR